MSKRSFLRPVALVAASIAVSVGHAHIPSTADQPVKAVNPAIERAVETPLAMVLGEFIITQWLRTQVMRHTRLMHHTRPILVADTNLPRFRS